MSEKLPIIKTNLYWDELSPKCQDWLRRKFEEKGMKYGQEINDDYDLGEIEIVLDLENLEKLNN